MLDKDLLVSTGLKCDSSSTLNRMYTSLDQSWVHVQFNMLFESYVLSSKCDSVCYFLYGENNTPLSSLFSGRWFEPSFRPTYVKLCTPVVYMLKYCLRYSDLPECSFWIPDVAIRKACTLETYLCLETQLNEGFRSNLNHL